MAGYGASPLIHPKLRARQRIRGSRVCDRRGVAVRAKQDFAGGESLAELEQPRLGGEIAALITEQAFTDLDAPVMRVGSIFTPVGFAKQLEDAILPTAEKIAEAARKLAGW